MQRSVPVSGRDVGAVERGEQEAVLEGWQVGLGAYEEGSEEKLVQQLEADIATSLFL